MSGAGGMDDQGLGVAHVGQVGCKLDLCRVYSV